MKLPDMTRKRIETSTAREIQAETDMTDVELLFWLIEFTESCCDPDKLWTHFYDNGAMEL